MAPPPNPPTTIILRIKVPPGSVPGNGSDVFDLGEVPTTATIGGLRQIIERALPSHPGPATQRLMFAGRALVDNDQTIADALNTRRDPTQTEYVVHLLVRSEWSHHPANPETEQSPVADARHGQPQVAAMQQPGMSPVNAQQYNYHNTHQLAHAQAHARALAQHQARQIAQQQAVAQAARLNAGNNPLQPHPHVHQAHAQHSRFPPPPPGFQNRAAFPSMMNPPGASVGQQSDTALNLTPLTAEQLQARIGPQAAPQVPAEPLGVPLPHQHVPLRPISGQGFHFQGVGPNGQHFQIHQHTLNFPGTTDAQRLATLMGAREAPRAAAPSALERARENMMEMQRMLDEMRQEAAESEGQRHRIENMQERVRSVHSYIDPLGVAAGSRERTGRTSAPPAAQTTSLPLSTQFPSNNGNNMYRPAWEPLGVPLPMRPSQHVPNVTCYLLSSPQGPQALLFSPEHGRYHGHFQTSTPLPHATPTVAYTHPHPQPAPTAAANQAHQALQLARPNQAADAAINQPPDAVAAAVAQQAQARAAEAANPLQALLGHFWLLLRVLIFAYFLLGSNMGWRRPMALALIGLGFWMVRMGLFGDGGLARRWWDGIVAIRPVQLAANQNPAGVANADPARQARQARQAGNAFPTPEEVAQRLLDAQNDQNRDRLQRLRELVRPIERVMALFIASLWPGIGEERVRLQEAEERRAREEEVERNRVAVEAQETERQKKAEEEKEDPNSGGEGNAADGTQVKQSAPADDANDGGTVGSGAEAATDSAASTAAPPIAVATGSDVASP
nr:hypothetical protein CFP56_77270 [Quercus suber]